MEYGYAVIMPKCCAEGISMEIIKELVHEGFKEQPLTSLICVCDISGEDVRLILDKTSNKQLCDSAKKDIKSAVVPIFVKGVDACKRLNEIAKKYNDNLSETNRYNDNMYVSYNQEEAIADFCEYIEVEDFSQIEDKLFNKDTNGVYPYDFGALKEYCKQNKLTKLR